MKEFLKENQCPIPGGKLLQEFPTTQLDLYTYEEGTETAMGKLARQLPERSADCKPAIMDPILSFHIGEVRVWGGFGIILKSNHAPTTQHQTGGEQAMLVHILMGMPTLEDGWRTRRIWWFHYQVYQVYQVQLKDDLWAHKDGDPTRRIAARDVWHPDSHLLPLIQRGEDRCLALA
jgi:hypothetical protein